MIPAHPLCWPEGWKRTPAYHRKSPKFSSFDRKLSIHEGVGRVLAQLDKLGHRTDDIVISTNVRTRLDGWPRSDQQEPSDPGVAVYWQKPDGTNQRVIAIDAYATVAGNLGAIAATLDAMRAIERHGGAQILERAFTGFTALPAPGASKHWREVLGLRLDVAVSWDDVVSAYQRMRSSAHPDRGGSTETFDAVQRAFELAKAELGR